jgi:hypothetical protein
MRGTARRGAVPSLDCSCAPLPWRAAATRGNDLIGISGDGLEAVPAQFAVQSVDPFIGGHDSLPPELSIAGSD